MAPREEVVFYTCVVADRDKPKRFLFKDEFRYVMFSDKAVVRNGWEVLPITYRHDDPVRVARYYKHNPFRLFPDCKFAIWLDATHWQVSSMSDLLGDYDISLMKHFCRNSVKEELGACIGYGMDDPDIMSAQFANYMNDGFLDDLGLYSTTCLIRKNTNKCRDFCDFWWEQICKWSKRDQLSFTYCAWKKKLNIQKMPGLCRQKGIPRADSKYLRMESHYVKRKFY